MQLTQIVVLNNEVIGKPHTVEKAKSILQNVMQLVKIGQNIGITSITGHKVNKNEMYGLLARTTYYGVYKHNGEYHQGSFEPIIPKHLFDQVQDVLHDRSKQKKQDWFHAYKGLMKCGGCGRSVTAETKRKYYKRTDRYAEYTYYRCTKRKVICEEEGVTDIELEVMLKSYINQITIDREVWDLGVKLLKAKNYQEMETQIQTRSWFEKDLEKVDRQLEALLTLRLNEEITADEYARQKKVYMDQRLEIQDKINDREHSTKNWLELAERFFETAYQAREVMEKGSPEEKKTLIQTVGWNLILKDKKLEFSFKKPYDILLKPDIRSDMQGCQDSNPKKRFWRPL